MKIYTKILLDKDNNLIEEKYFNYYGPISHAGIHYSYKNEKPKKAMEKQARRERKLAEKRLKKQQKAIDKGLVTKDKNENKTIPISETITLDHLTRNNK
tara:strand:+ start:503 stop:799 length:297 start_codon:yes stop_codon:yes gene_type:complete